MYGQVLFTPKIIKEHSYAPNTLRAYSQGCEVTDLIVKSFPIAVLDILGKSQWKDMLQEVL